MPPTSRNSERQPNCWPSAGRDWCTDQRRNGQAEHHPAYGLRTAAGVGDRSRDQRGNAEIRAMRQARKEPRQREQQHIGRNSAEQVAESKAEHEDKQQVAAAELGREEGNGGCADHHAQRIGAYQMSRRRDRYVEANGDVGQQAHDRKLAGSDAKAAGCKSEKHERCRAASQRHMIGRTAAGIPQDGFIHIEVRSCDWPSWTARTTRRRVS